MTLLPLPPGSGHDNGGVGYKGESSGPKTIFIKSSFLDDSINVSVKKPVVKFFATK